MKSSLSPHTMRSYRRFLGELPLFAGLSPAQLDELAHGTCNVIYQKGQPVFRAGDSAGQMYAVVSGQAKISLSCRRGNERVLELVGPGHVFGHADFFNGWETAEQAKLVNFCLNGLRHCGPFGP